MCDPQEMKSTESFEIVIPRERTPLSTPAGWKRHAYFGHLKYGGKFASKKRQMKKNKKNYDLAWAIEKEMEARKAGIWNGAPYIPL